MDGSCRDELTVELTVEALSAKNVCFWPWPEDGIMLLQCWQLLLPLTCLSRLLLLCSLCGLSVFRLDSFGLVQADVGTTADPPSSGG